MFSGQGSATLLGILNQRGGHPFGDELAGYEISHNTSVFERGGSGGTDCCHAHSGQGTRIVAERLSTIQPDMYTIYTGKDQPIISVALLRKQSRAIETMQ